MLPAKEASWPNAACVSRPGAAPSAGGADSGHFDRSALARALCRSGFPEPVRRPENSDRAAWYDAYLTTVIRRDIRERADIDHLSARTGWPPTRFRWAGLPRTSRSTSCSGRRVGAAFAHG